MKPGKRTFLKACFTACLSLAVLLGVYSVLTFSVTSGESSPSARISPSASEREAAEAPPPALEVDFQRPPVVFFKTLKHHLNLERETQLRDFDGIISHITIVMSRYVFLAFEQRCHDDPRTLGTLIGYNKK